MTSYIVFICRYPRSSQPCGVRFQVNTPDLPPSFLVRVLYMQDASPSLAGRNPGESGSCCSLRTVPFAQETEEPLCHCVWSHFGWPFPGLKMSVWCCMSWDPDAPGSPAYVTQVSSHSLPPFLPPLCGQEYLTALYKQAVKQTRLRAAEQLWWSQARHTEIPALAFHGEGDCFHVLLLTLTTGLKSYFNT